MSKVKAYLRGLGHTPPVMVLATSRDGHALVREVGKGNPMDVGGVSAHAHPYIVDTRSLYAHREVQGLGAHFTLWGVPDYSGLPQVEGWRALGRLDV